MRNLRSHPTSSPQRGEARPRRDIPIAVPAVGEREWESVREPLMSGWLTQGPKVHEFETRFANRHRVQHAIASTSCTTALHLTLVALRIGPGDEVIVPSFTWVATANVVLYCGAKPVFVDVDPDTFNIDPQAAAAAVTERTRAAIPVHLFGLCADMDALRSGLPDDVHLVEDAACAIGSEYHGVPAGGLGDAGCFSFHPRKIITTGEGGMVTTHDSELAARIDSLRNHGASIPEEVRHRSAAPYEMPEFNVLGFNYRMTDVQAAIGLSQLDRLDGLLTRRGELAQLYREALADVDWLRVPRVPEGFRHSWQSFVVKLEPDSPVEPDELMARLLERGVSTRPGTHAVPGLRLYRERLGEDLSAYPAAAMLEHRTVAIPLHNRMSGDDVEYVVEAIHEAVR